MEGILCTSLARMLVKRPRPCKHFTMCKEKQGSVNVLLNASFFSLVSPLLQVIEGLQME